MVRTPFDGVYRMVASISRASHGDPPPGGSGSRVVTAGLRGQFLVADDHGALLP